MLSFNMKIILDIIWKYMHIFIKNIKCFAVSILFSISIIYYIFILDEPNNITLYIFVGTNIQNNDFI
jgi:hypothetical protein